MKCDCTSRAITYAVAATYSIFNAVHISHGQSTTSPFGNTVLQWMFITIVSSEKYNLNQQTSLFNFHSSNSTCKVNADESFVSSTLKPATAYQTSGSCFFLSLQFR